jgi:hypothetical protein
LSLAMPPRPPPSGQIWVPNRKTRLSSSSMRTGTSLHGSHLIWLVYPRNLHSMH